MAVRYFLPLLLLLAACSKAPQDKDAVRQAVLDHLAKRSDMLAAAMKIEVVSVSFRDKEADAIVSVSPKEGGTGIQMSYALAMEGGKWVVQKPASPAAGAPNPHGGGAPPPSMGEMPAGHPPVPTGPAPNGSVHPPSPKAQQ